MHDPPIRAPTLGDPSVRTGAFLATRRPHVVAVLESFKSWAITIGAFSAQIRRGTQWRADCSFGGMQGFEPDPQTFQIIGAAMEVHRQLHRGLFEGFYCDALGVEFSLRQIPFEAERPIQLEYKGHVLRGVYRLDFICFASVAVEVKAVSALTPADESQLLNYLAMTRIERGLLINFGAKSLEYKRRVL